MAEHSNQPSQTHSAWSAALRNPLVIALTGLLAVQVLVAAISGGQNKLTPAASDTPLTAVNAQSINNVEIATPDGKAPLVLTRTDAGWILPNLGDFPADATRADQLVNALAGLHRPLPIATSEAARKRFKVADDDFENRIVLRAGEDTLSTLLVGDSPGFRRRYLRPAGDQGVYDVRFEVFNLSDQPRDWISQDHLRLERDHIQQIAGADWNLAKDGDSWALTGSAAANASALDQTKVNDLLTQLANLSYREVLGTEIPEGFDAEQSMLALKIGLSDGQSRTVLLGKRPAAQPTAEDSPATPQDYVVKADDQPYYYLLSELDLGPLLGLGVSSLTETPQPVQSGEQTTGAAVDEPPATTEPAVQAPPADPAAAVPEQTKTD